MKSLLAATILFAGLAATPAVADEFCGRLVCSKLSGEWVSTPDPLRQVMSQGKLTVSVSMSPKDQIANFNYSWLVDANYPIIRTRFKRWEGTLGPVFDGLIAKGDVIHFVRIVVDTKDVPGGVDENRLKEVLASLTVAK